MKEGNTVQCGLCPKRCEIAPGQSGECRIRINIDGQLTAVTYGHPCSLHVDPVEKKPLFHFWPGSAILSVATVGCNLHCLNCQNWEISQLNPENSRSYAISPQQLVDKAVELHCPSIAYTYTDPVVYYEYALDSSRKAKEKGLKNVLVTAAYVSPGPWKELCSYADAANIDLKAFSDEFYQKICSATLRPVLEALLSAKNAGVMVEVTNLVIPTLNDSDEMLTDLCRWIKQYMGVETPLHFSRFWPRYRMKNLPATPEKTLLRARDIARAEGLQFVYVGNLACPDGGTTFCPSCNAVVVERRGYKVMQENINKNACGRCGQRIYGIWQ